MFDVDSGLLVIVNMKCKVADFFLCSEAQAAWLSEHSSAM